MTFLNLFYFFVFYSFLGWLTETTYVSIKRKHFVNMGFLDGPFSPIYGSGAIALILFVFPFRQYLFFFLIMSIIITSIIEYITSFFFEKFFKVTWWNYSNEPFNLNGRICLGTSVCWGILSVLVLTFIHPIIVPIANFISNQIGFLGVIIFTIYFIIDATGTFNILIKFKKIISQHLDIKIHPKITRLINSFPNFRSKINNNFVAELKLKLKKLNHPKAD